ncbi:1-acyl-sn-glycerol-3-phosphate acyltransferase [Dokdonia sinensis]|uniref:1-acyl-sn-glycerol-3-phosphate acyltransferase n=1 Tax=Dokdonia sinensis TaxID=2479847 RepID=A0A3M0G0W7_9FLAO|nr:1-acyl-sn-glycerol-3-phosphate acyltransferase [Dokdonia sinensis]RMB58611.1 1-acyl-sn-glycerol-3-phosphate acyltransferase [Dokdonia sinensis]
MTKFEEIRPYNDDEVNEALKHHAQHPMFKVLLQFTFPEKSPEEIQDVLADCHSIYDFQTKVIYKSVQNLLEKSSEGFSTRGFDTLKEDKTYLYISNHRDIVLDTSLLNIALLDNGLISTASAIGDNLVQKDFLMALSKLNRNFLVQRSTSPRELLRSSKLLSEYMGYLQEQGRSVWVAQREGRTKNGSDVTQQGVLKMITMAKGDVPMMEYLKNLNIVPVAISYEYDPTDTLKIPEIVAKEENLPYVKTANEDFNSILKGALGNKKHIEIACEKLSQDIYDRIENEEQSDNDKLQRFAQEIDRNIYRNYKLWPSNYVAYDLYHKTDEYATQYTIKDKRQFERRIERRVDASIQLEVDSFLLMYANPVINQRKS